MYGKVFRTPSKASGSQIGKRTKKMVVCLKCNRAKQDCKTRTPCPDCGDKLVTFDSTGEWKQWLILLNAEKSGVITELERQLRMPLKTPNGNIIGHYVVDYKFKENGRDIYGDYKGGAMTELAAWKIKHFNAQHDTEVVIFGGK